MIKRKKMSKHYKKYQADQAQKFGKEDNKYSGRNAKTPSNRYLRKKCLIDLIDKSTDLLKDDEILIVGCANPESIEIWEDRGFKNVTGIDISNHWPDRILKMDMQDLKFEEEKFNLVMFSHSLEHAYNFYDALYEADRVLKPGGYIAIEVPISFHPDKFDRFDFFSALKLSKYINVVGKYKTVFAQNYKKGEADNFCWNQCAKLIVKKI